MINERVRQESLIGTHGRTRESIEKGLKSVNYNLLVIEQCARFIENPMIHRTQQTRIAN